MSCDRLHVRKICGALICEVTTTRPVGLRRLSTLLLVAVILDDVRCYRCRELVAHLRRDVIRLDGVDFLLLWRYACLRTVWVLFHVLQVLRQPYFIRRV